jgi:hypothetical protein
LLVEEVAAHCPRRAEMFEGGDVEDMFGKKSLLFVLIAGKSYSPSNNVVQFLNL